MGDLRRKAWDGSEVDPYLDRLIKDIQKDKERLQSISDPNSNTELSEKIDKAMQNGLDQGKSRMIRHRKRRISVRLSAAALVILFMLTAFVRISPAFAVFMKEIPGFSRFVELVSFDQSLATAISNEYMQIVNKSDERNGYKLTVNGVIADSQRVVLLYTAEGPGINEEDTTFLPYEIKDGNGSSISANIISSHYFREGEDENAGVQDYVDIMMSPGVSVPQEIQFKLEVGSEWLEVMVPIDHQRFEGMREEIQLNETVVVAGQRIHIKKAVMTPLQVSVTMEGDKNNSKRLNGLIQLELLDDRGRRYTTNMGMGDLDSEITRHFQSAYFEKPQSLTLKAQGLLLSNRNLRVVIDIEREAMLTAPDSRLQLADVIKQEDAIDLKFILNQSDDPESVKRALSLFAYEGMVRDASGKTYPIKSSDSKGKKYASFFGGNMIEVEYYYHIPNAEYKQPLTLEVNEYLGHVLQDISVKIK